MKPDSAQGRITADLLFLERKKEDADKKVAAAGGCLPLCVIGLAVCLFFGYGQYCLDKKVAVASNAERMETFEAEMAAWSKAVALCEDDPKCGQQGRAKLPSKKPKLTLTNEGGLNGWFFGGIVCFFGLIALLVQYTQNKEMSEKAGGKIAKNLYYLGIDDKH